MASQSGQFLRKLLEPIVAGAGDRARPAEGALSPASPLERNPQSPKCWKKRDSDGVGLGIVAALERSSSGEKSPRTIVAGATAPISIGSPRTPGGRRPSFEAPESGCNGSGGWRLGERASAAAPATCGDETRKETGFGAEPPATATKAEESESYRIADFLNCCDLCRKKLDGKDIYMYRGEKAFCSVECRYQQIVSDEYQEKCGLGVRSTPEITSSSYSGGAGQLFFTGIVVS